MCSRQPVVRNPHMIEPLGQQGFQWRQQDCPRMGGKMKKEIVSVPGETPARHLSRAVRFGDLVFISGTTGRNPETKELPGSMEGQARQTMETIKRALEASGSSMDNVLKMTCYVTDLAEKRDFDDVYVTYFSSEPPARACVQVASLGKGVKLEIETIAEIPG